MKKIKYPINYICRMIMLFVFAFTSLGCGGGIATIEPPSLDVIDIDTNLPALELHFSYPTVYLTDGSFNFSYPLNPVTGTDIKNATVTISNETTGVSTTAAYVSDSPRGYYTTASNFSHNPGEQVSATIKTTKETITASPTITPNPVYSNLIPATSNTVNLPFTISWEVTQGHYEASHTWIIITEQNSTAESKNYQEVIAASQKSLQITSSKLQPGTYSIVVFGVNSMTIKGAKSGSVGYVDGAGTSAQSSLVKVQ